MATKILCVDDDLIILKMYERNLGRSFEIETALSGELGLVAINASGPFAAVLSDMKMPGMDGTAFLQNAAELAPDTVRIMLTGNVDQETAIRAVNEGNVFRFVNKPCDAETLVQTIHAALKHHKLIAGERELLELTLNGSVKLLTDILSMADPAAFGKAQLLRDYARNYLKVTKYEDSGRWEIELAAMFLDLGRMTVPQGLLEKQGSGGELSEAEFEIFSRIPEAGAELIAHIPRLEKVAEIVRYQNKPYEELENPADDRQGEAIPFGSRLLKVLRDLIDKEASGVPRTQAIDFLRNRKGIYDVEILAKCAAYLRCRPSVEQEAELIITILVSQLTNKHVLVSDLITKEGMMIAPSGTEISDPFLQKIRNFGKLHDLGETIRVRSRMA